MPSSPGPSLPGERGQASQGRFMCKHCDQAPPDIWGASRRCPEHPMKDEPPRYLRECEFVPSPLTNVSIGRFVKALRRGAGLSQQQVAEALGCPRSAVSLIESGRRQLTALEGLRLLFIGEHPS